MVKMSPKLKSFLAEIRQTLVQGKAADDFDPLQAERLREDFKRNYPELEQKLEELRKPKQNNV